MPDEISEYLDELEELDRLVEGDKARVEEMRKRLASEPHDSPVWDKIAKVLDTA